ncbi:GAF domain-containing protein [Pseudaestuariivita sp.]|uniref:GAF domain-containing protein n=1 Tax=Pseudaestuariivita sp. TaxID=2211669 RepID=UPI00405868A8
MLDGKDAKTSRTFVEVSEVWVPEGDRLVWKGGDYGDLDDFKAVSGKETFGKGEGLPGKAWSEGRPVVLKGFEGSYFKRIEAAHAAGLTAAVAVPVFAGDTLKAVLVTLCGDGDDRIGAIEVWSDQGGVLKLDDGYFGSADHFEWVSRHTQFPRGQGMPGSVWSTGTPLLMRNLGSGYKFVRAESAGEAGLTTGLGLPVPVPGNSSYVLALLSARGTPLARRFEIWDARKAVVGTAGGAVLIDGVCSTDGPLGLEEPKTRAAAWQGVIGNVASDGIPIAKRQLAGLPGGHTSVVALPIHAGDTISHVVAWYS